MVLCTREGHGGIGGDRSAAAYLAAVLLLAAVVMAGGSQKFSRPTGLLPQELYVIGVKTTTARHWRWRELLAVPEFALPDCHSRLVAGCGRWDGRAWCSPRAIRGGQVVYQAPNKGRRTFAPASWATIPSGGADAINDHIYEFQTKREGPCGHIFSGVAPAWIPWWWGEAVQILGRWK